MGYTTEFKGKFRLSRKLNDEEYAVLIALNDERHGGNINVYSGFPGYWCGWLPTADRSYIVWDGQEKFYHYIEWLNFIVDRHLEPWGVTVTGTVRWTGETKEDKGRIRFDQSVMTVHRAKQKKVQ